MILWTSCREDPCPRLRIDDIVVSDGEVAQQLEERLVPAAQTPAASGGIGPILPVHDAGDGKDAASNVVLPDAPTFVETEATSKAEE